MRREPVGVRNSDSRSDRRPPPRGVVELRGGQRRGDLPLVHLGPEAEARPGLVKTFGATRAVDGIDLSIAEGEIFGVLGPNGAGKTTMLQMLATLLPIDSGGATIFGHDVRHEPHAVRQLIGVRPAR